MLLGRLVINMQFRVVYPFLPTISRGLGVPLEIGSLLITARSLVGMTSPVWGVLADRYGRKPMMLIGLVALIAGTATIVVAPGFGLVLAGFAILGACRAAYDPASQAYASDRVPYERRGKILGLLELPWSGSWLIGVPLAGILIAAFGWRSPFLALAVFGLFTLALTVRFLPSSGRHDRLSLQAAREIGLQLRAGTRALTGPVLAVTSVTALVSMAGANIMLIYGAWFEQQYGLATVALGAVSIVIAVAELASEAATTLLVDRLGKRRSLLAGIWLTAGAYLLLPHMSATLLAGIGAMALLTVFYEFCMVSALPLMSELAQEARAVVMGTNAALVSAAVLVDSLLAPRIWKAGGLQAERARLSRTCRCGRAYPLAQPPRPDDRKPEPTRRSILMRRL